MLAALTGNVPNAGHPRRQWTFARLAKAAAAVDLPFLMMRPGGVRLHDGGLRLEGWLARVHGEDTSFQPVAVPVRTAVVWDAMYLNELREQGAVYRRALRRIQNAGWSRFNPGLPAKDVLIARFQERSPAWLPQTNLQIDDGRLTRLLDEVPALWLKPVIGSGGQNMAYVRKLGADRYWFEAARFFGEAVSCEMGRQELVRTFQTASASHAFFVQEDVHLLTSKDGRKLDFRFTLARDRTGQWRELAVTARLGAENACLTNYHAGGEAISLQTASRNQLEYLARMGLTKEMTARGSALAMDVAGLLCEQYPDLALLGIDVGINADGACYAYDFNTRPGRDILSDEELERLLACIAGFANYLQSDRGAASR